MKPCVRCLSDKYKRIRAGKDGVLCIIQCLECGFNVTALTWELAEKAWNGFRVWELVEKQKEAA